MLPEVPLASTPSHIPPAALMLLEGPEVPALYSNWICALTTDLGSLPIHSCMVFAGKWGENGPLTCVTCPLPTRWNSGLTGSLWVSEFGETDILEFLHGSPSPWTGHTHVLCLTEPRAHGCFGFWFDSLEKARNLVHVSVLQHFYPSPTQ